MKLRKSYFWIVIAAALLSTGCKKSVEEVEPLLPSIDDVLNNAESRYHVDFSTYPEDIRLLPIGVVCDWNDYYDAVDQITNIDSYNNINGSMSGDDILDFAGEHFIYLALRDSLAGMSSDEIRDRAVQAAAMLMSGNLDGQEKEQVKFIIFASPFFDNKSLEAVRQLISLGGQNVHALGIRDTIDMRNVAAACYRRLRAERNLALRITPQASSLIIDPAPIPEPAEQDTTLAF